ncbi:MAG TPA: hypothetical protein VFB14_25765 [Bryobacteraceae bacterium]|jgi:hypothetical protein|nr:hypothetical protein [Bryobacteraceae bacterium]
MRRDEQTIEAELIEIMGIQDDMVKLERIVAWCAAYPDEIPFALRFFRKRSPSSEKRSTASASTGMDQ